MAQDMKSDNSIMATSETPSMMQKAMPYVQAIAPAAIQMFKNPRARAAGSGLLQGYSAITNYQANAEKEKRANAEFKLRTRDKAEEQKRLDQRFDPTMTLFHKKRTPGQQKWLEEQYSKYTDADGTINGWDKKAIFDTLGQNIDAMKGFFEMGNLERKTEANAAYEKYLNDAAKHGEQSGQAQKSRKEAERLVNIYEARRQGGNEYIQNLNERKEKEGELLKHFEPKSVQLWMKGEGDLELLDEPRGAETEATSKMKDAAYLKTQGFTDKEANRIAYDIGKGKVTREGLKMRLVEKIFAKTQPEEMRDAQLALIPEQLDYVFGKEKGKDVPGEDVDSTKGVFTLSDGSTATQSDIEFTAEKYNMTIEEVKAKLGVK